MSPNLDAKIAFMFTENRIMVSTISLEALFSFHIKISFSFTDIVSTIAMNRASQFTILGVLDKVLYSFFFTL